MELREMLLSIFPEKSSSFDFTWIQHMWISIGIGILAVLLVLYYLYMTKSEKLQESKHDPAANIVKRRFRKREKIAFYGKKMWRKVQIVTKTIKTDSSSRGKSKKKQLLRLARRLLLKKEQPAQRLRKEPPPTFLEADLPELEHEHRLPPEVVYMLKSVRVFGHFEKPVFLELCKHMEARNVLAGQHLFRVGDLDDSIFVVQSGKLNVYARDLDGSEHCMKQVTQGDHIHSLLSVIDVLTANTQAYKTVSAVALEDSIVLRLPLTAFQSILLRFPETMVRVVQIVMVRLQRVTFMAMHNYLGLGLELINPASQSDKSLSVHTLHRGSPSRQSSRTATPSASKEEVVQKVTDFPGLEESDGSSAESSKRKLHTQLSEPITISNRAKAHSIALNAEELERTSSDFIAAVTRARIGSLPDSNPIAIGSPPVKASAEETEASGGSRSPKKINLSGPLASSSGQSVPEDDYVLRLATKDIAKLLGLHDESELTGKLALKTVHAGTTLVKQGDQNVSLMFVVSGTLQVLQQVVGKEQEERSLFVVHPGELVGTLAVLTGEPSFFTIRARSNVWLVMLTNRDFYTLMSLHPEIVLNVGRVIVKRMSSFVRQIDFALDWMAVEAGKSLFRQGEKSECIYIVLNGRLRSVMTLVGGKKELVGEYGRGELVGLVEVLTQTERATTVMAVRDTELAVLPEELLNMIKRKYPQIVTRLVHLLGQRILGTLKNRNVVALSKLEHHPSMETQRPVVANLATVAILAVTDDVPLFNFTLELQYALGPIGPTLRLTSDIIEKRLGTSALDPVNEYRLSSWLGQQEDIHRIVLYQCDSRMTAWTQHCIRQADCILIVGLASKGPVVGDLEKQIEHIAVRAQKELILLYTEDARPPRNTVEWLNARGWCSSHHHIRCPKRVFSKRPTDRMMQYYRNLFESQEPDRLSDFSRLARFLTGTAVGLVLGGGGARGIAHIGMIRAMLEAGIPIDMVGGTSIGAFMGGLWCKENDITPFIRKAREWSMEMSKLMPKILDLTYPVSAMFSGRSFNRSIEQVFKDTQIEDLWIPYFNITTDITASKMRVHSNGSLWRYVRASMSLSGYLPPLCDPIDGNLLLDGGYVNNLPADVMKMMGVQSIFAIDVGSQDDTNLTNYGDELSGWWLLWKKWNPWAKPIRVPNLAEIQSRLAYVSCVRQLEEVKNSGCCEYIRPPIDKYATLAFGQFDEIHEVGYSHGKAVFSTWTKRDLVKELFKENSTGRLKPHMHKSQVPVEPDFTDLAEIVCRIDAPASGGLSNPSFHLESDASDDEYEDVMDEEMLSFSPGPSLTTLSTPKNKPMKTRSLSGSSLHLSHSASGHIRKRASSSELRRYMSSTSPSSVSSQDSHK